MRKSTSWVYKNWQALGGRKLGGSLFFPKKEDLYERLFCKRQGQGVALRFHLEGDQAYGDLVQNQNRGKNSRGIKKKGVNNPPPEPKTPTDMAFLDLVNRRLDYLKDHKTENYFRDTLYMAKRWAGLWGTMYCGEIVVRYLHIKFEDPSLIISRDIIRKLKVGQ